MRKEKRQPTELFGARTDLGLAASECGTWAAGQSGDTKLKDEKNMKTQQSVFLKRFGKKPRSMKTQKSVLKRFEKKHSFCEKEQL